ncbi:type ISP restriction/modification enzyme [Micrococcus luteus]|uniref:type ISP restriction/modification enzyme n=1 Tax=Micrococcus luteus TaxID=1270 RepID=UPI0018EF3478|nr:type ISP restriction/modification enzyme [Micrococcus luteus]
MIDAPLAQLAETYARDVRLASTSGVSAEPEAQLTVPVSEFLRAFSSVTGIGDLSLLREAQLDGVRPDFAALIDGRPCGWVELKAPGHTVIGEKWRGREKGQWDLLSQLDALLVSNGDEIALYVSGSLVDTAFLPVDGVAGWDADRLRTVLEQFTLAQPRPITRVSQLADRLAPLARFLRERLQEGLSNNYRSVREAKAAWDHTVHHTTTDAQFAGDVAQVVAYSMAIAGLSGQADRNADGVVTLEEAKHALETAHRNVLAASLGPIIGIPALMEYIAPEVGAIMRLVSSMDVAAIERSTDSRGEPWLWFYEDFLQRYDPAARNRAGVYYTPISVVQCQVRVVDALLRERFGQTLGFGAPSVVTLDPATGSGTYPLAVIDRAEAAAREERGPAGVAQVAKNLTKNLLAFELLPGPYSVAHLRIGQRLAEAQGHAFQAEEIGVYLTDTLEDPSAGMEAGLFGDARVLAEAAEAARQIKRDRRITVAIGNPPYDRVTSGTGGWVEHGDGEDALFDDVIGPAQEQGVIFSAQASLYNLYVYFWRWAIWKAFQQDPGDQAIISFITASSWLTGPAFVGLRDLARRTASEIWVMDLGGEGRGARQEENVFDIQTPVAIVTLVRTGEAAREASVYYRRFRGTRAEKFAALDAVARLDPSDALWERLPGGAGDPLAPASGGEDWAAMPALADLFPWQQPGIQFSRAWPVAPDPDTLRRRWQELLRETDAEVRAHKYVTSRWGRNIHTVVQGMDPISALAPSASHAPTVRLGWRSFDRQWTFDDPRLAKTDSPSLWQSWSTRQVYMVSPRSSRISGGPAVYASAYVPDLNSYFGSGGGKDVIPLYRDAEATQPNVTGGLLPLLGERYRQEVTPEDLAAYVMGVAGHDAYVQRFDEALEGSPVRVPLTADPDLFTRAVKLGERLLWLQTYGERFTGVGRPAGRVPRIPGLGWEAPVTALPASPRAVSYNPATQRLTVGDGVVTGVSPEVRAFAVSGMNVLDKWLGARTATGIGRAAGKAATPLDRIRPIEWADEWNDELLDLLRVLTETVSLGGDQADLLDEILAGDLIPANELPEPTPTERKVPKTIKRDFSTAQEEMF